MIKKILILFFMTLMLQAETNHLPLEGRKFGVELNLPRLLTYSASWKSASGTFSYFDHENRVEIAVPWLLARHAGRSEKYYDRYDTKSVDIHYRKFLNDEMNGFYLSGFGRLIYLDGKLRNENARQRTLKAGIGIGLGFRLFPTNERFYWGAGLIVGRYLSNQNDIYTQDSVDFFIYEDLPVIIDVELLKFGYAF